MENIMKKRVPLFAKYCHWTYDDQRLMDSFLKNYTDNGRICYLGQNCSLEKELENLCSGKIDRLVFKDNPCKSIATVFGGSRQLSIESEFWYGENRFFVVRSGFLQKGEAKPILFGTDSFVSKEFFLFPINQENNVILIGFVQKLLERNISLVWTAYTTTYWIEVIVEDGDWITKEFPALKLIGKT